ncbi:MAG: hypothetical protein ABIZ80_00530, partial [Bryobacteraceae bacterium]
IAVLVSAVNFGAACVWRGVNESSSPSSRQKNVSAAGSTEWLDSEPVKRVNYTAGAVPNKFRLPYCRSSVLKK